MAAFAQSPIRMSNSQPLVFSRRRAPEICGSSPLETGGGSARRQARVWWLGRDPHDADRGACGRATAVILGRGSVLPGQFPAGFPRLVTDLVQPA